MSARGDDMGTFLALLLGAAAGAAVRSWWLNQAGRATEPGAADHSTAAALAGRYLREDAMTGDLYLRHELTRRRALGMPRHHPELLTVDLSTDVPEQLDEIETHWADDGAEPS